MSILNHITNAKITHAYGTQLRTPLRRPLVAHWAVSRSVWRASRRPEAHFRRWPGVRGGKGGGKAGWLGVKAPAAAGSAQICVRGGHVFGFFANL